MGFLNVLFSHGMEDTGFIQNWVTGADAVGQEVKPYTPELVQKICGVQERLVEKAAILYGSSKPAALHWGVSTDMSPSALGTAHALTSLMVLSGNLDVPGGNLIVTDPFGISRRGVDGSLAESLQREKTGLSEYPMTGSGYPYAQADVLLDQIASGRTVKCAWYQGTGVTANGFAHPARAADLLSKTGFSVMVDLFMSPEADELADLFLPVCTCVERKGIRNWWYQLAAFDRVIEPLGESRSDMEILLEAGRLLAPSHFPWTDVTGWFDHVLKPSGCSWQQLSDRGWLMPGTEYLKYLSHGGFPTFSGKVELQPELMDRAGLLPAPWFESPPSGKEKYPLNLTTGARTPVFFHGEHRNVPELREHEPVPTVEVHPDDLPDGVQSGDWIQLESPWGVCKRVVSPSPLIKKGVLSAAHGWRGSGLNINELLGSGLSGRGGMGYPFRCIPCRIRGPVEPPPDMPASKGESAVVIGEVDTVWCTGCRACQVACSMHTGQRGIIVRMKNGEWAPGFTIECLRCADPPCVAACHTRCLEVF
jgi:anaerobic selenocysteine-containing dehydrogenase